MKSHAEVWDVMKVSAADNISLMANLLQMAIGEKDPELYEELWQIVDQSPALNRLLGFKPRFDEALQKAMGLPEPKSIPEEAPAPEGSN